MGAHLEFPFSERKQFIFSNQNSTFLKDGGGVRGARVLNSDQRGFVEKMQSFWRTLRKAGAIGSSIRSISLQSPASPKLCIWSNSIMEHKLRVPRDMIYCNYEKFQKSIAGPPFRCMTTAVHLEPSSTEGTASASPGIDQPQRIKFKRLDKTAKHIMNILDKEAVDKVRADREIPDIKPGYIIQLKVEVPENKRRVSILKGIVIARRNAGLNTTFRLRRLVAGVGVESVFPLYSPNIKEMKVLDKKKVRRAKLYYLRDRMNALKK